MPKRHRKRKQDNSALITLLIVGLLAVGLGANQEQSLLLVICLIAVLCALAVGGFIIMNEKQKRERLARSGIAQIDVMTGLEFEKYLQALLQRRGYRNIELTINYDLGVDLIAEKNGERWGIQAKRYKGNVGLDAVRQVVTAADYYKCDRSMVITNSYFTKNAKTIAQSKGCVLIDRDELTKLILSLA